MHCAGTRPLLILEVILQLNWNSNAVGVRLKWAMADLILDRRRPPSCPTATLPDGWAGLVWKASWKPTMSRFHKRRTFQFFSLIRSTWQLSKLKPAVLLTESYWWGDKQQRNSMQDKLKRHWRCLTAFNLTIFLAPLNLMTYRDLFWDRWKLLFW